MEIHIEEYARTNWYSITFREGAREMTFTVVEDYDANADHSNFEFVDGEGLDKPTKEKILEAIEKHAIEACSCDIFSRTIQK